MYAIQSQANQLHADLWPSAAKFEAEIVAMTAHMLGAGQGDAPFGSEHGICGSVTSGGSESILLAMKTYRDWARDKRGITAPEIVLPVSRMPPFIRRPSISIFARGLSRWMPTIGPTSRPQPRRSTPTRSRWSAPP